MRERVPAAGMTEFTERVLRAIKKIPRGKVATYGQIAKLAGKPHGSRGVAWILHSSSRKRGLPWQRVVGAGGKISFPWESAAHVEQRRRLEREGVDFLPSGKIAMAKCQWIKGAKAPRKKR
jgi:methylated-DNA-protein-cysteine methyltransferase-like protein